MAVESDKETNNCKGLVSEEQLGLPLATLHLIDDGSIGHRITNSTPEDSSQEKNSSEKAE